MARVIAQTDGQRLGHIGADERDSSQARFVVGSRVNEAKTEIKGGIKTFYSRDGAWVFITREQGSVYLQSRLPVSKQINRAVQTIRASHALAGGGPVVSGTSDSRVSSAAHSGALHSLLRLSQLLSTIPALPLVSKGGFS